MKIIKEGYVTRVMSKNPDLDINDIVGERSGERHNIIAVVGQWVLDKTSHGYQVLYITSDDAEPYSSYRNLDQAIADLNTLEKIEITQDQKIDILVADNSHYISITEEQGCK